MVVGRYILHLILLENRNNISGCSISPVNEETELGCSQRFSDILGIEVLLSRDESVPSQIHRLDFDPLPRTQNILKKLLP